LGKQVQAQGRAKIGKLIQRFQIVVGAASWSQR
jgi:hypothetical protein